MKLLNELSQLFEADKGSILKVQQDLIDLLPDSFDVHVVKEHYFDRLYLRVTNGNDTGIRVEWHGNRSEYTITREYETGDGQYPVIRSLKELATILTNELE